VRDTAQSQGLSEVFGGVNRRARGGVYAVRFGLRSTERGVLSPDGKPFRVADGVVGEQISSSAVHCVSAQLTLGS
jgi:hypothetical protein